MFRTLYSKLAAILLGLFALVGVAATYGTLLVVKMFHHEAQQVLNLPLAHHLAAQNRITSVQEPNAAALRAMFDRQMMVNPNIEIYLLDVDGKILAHSGNRGVKIAEQVDLAPVRRLLAEQPELPIYGADPRGSAIQRIFSAARIPAQGPIEGYLYVSLRGDDHAGMRTLWRNSSVIKLAVGMGVLILCLGLLAGLLLFGTITRRLERLAQAMDEFKRSDFSVRPFIAIPHGETRGDEIERLTANFHDLALRTSSQLNKLKQTDVLRRELVANVSHDLKTPLATLQGYIDTLLLKEDRLSKQEQSNYLQIASRSCQRLGKLVADLIELAKLDAKEVTLHAEPFSPAELVQDVAQKFQLKAQEKRIRLEAEIPERIPYVTADIALIERVLENLIGNALSHTHPGGVVRVGLETVGNEVSLHVADTGVGIPAEEVPHIFERFYRVSRHERGDGEHAGLGLAITKSILDLHGAHMQVTSKEGVGTTFAFGLAVPPM